MLRSTVPFLCVWLVDYFSMSHNPNPSRIYGYILHIMFTYMHYLHYSLNKYSPQIIENRLLANTMQISEVLSCISGSLDVKMIRLGQVFPGKPINHRPTPQTSTFGKRKRDGREKVVGRY